MQSVEKWVDIPGYENFYQINNYGEVKSKDRIVKNGWGYRTMYGKTITPYVCNSGYKMVRLYEKSKCKNCLVHRLVAKAFLPNPNSLPQVNHKDETKTNNFIFINPDGSVNPEKSNLEWCTEKYNTNYGTHNKRMIISKSKPVIQYSIDGDYIREWESATAVEKEKEWKQTNIQSCCVGRYKAAYGYVWRYK